jgi:hypothetical protein
MLIRHRCARIAAGPATTSIVAARMKAAYPPLGLVEWCGSIRHANHCQARVRSEPAAHVGHKASRGLTSRSKSVSASAADTFEWNQVERYFSHRSCSSNGGGTNAAGCEMLQRRELTLRHRTAIPLRRSASDHTSGDGRMTGMRCGREFDLACGIATNAPTALLARSRTLHTINEAVELSKARVQGQPFALVAELISATGMRAFVTGVEYRRPQSLSRSECGEGR